jgi:hypothetical protein
VKLLLKLFKFIIEQGLQAEDPFFTSVEVIATLRNAARAQHNPEASGLL